MQRTLLAVAVSLGVSACAAGTAGRPVNYGPPGMTPPVASVSDDHDEVVCQDERPTGSNIARSSCRTQAEINHEHDAGKAWMERNPANPPYHESDDPFKRIHE